MSRGRTSAATSRGEGRPGSNQEGTQRKGAHGAAGTQRESDGFRLRTSIDRPGMMRGGHAGSQEHEMEGQNTTPGAEVRFNERSLH